MKRIVFLILSLCVAVAIYGQKPVNLRCEYLEKPIGIDVDSPRLLWQIDDKRSGAYQQSYRVEVSTDSVSLLKGDPDSWNSGEVASYRGLAIYSGKELEPFKKYFWRVTISDQFGKSASSEISSFETGLRGEKQWKGSWISDGHDMGGNSISAKSAPYFRKEFSVDKSIVSARAYIAVGGLYELSINGEKIGDHRLDPMYTRYDRRNLYVTYDVTEQLQQGDNAVGVLLGNGWYNHQSTAVWYFHRAPWRNRPTFCLDIHVNYSDGSSDVISTDRSWKNSAGPLIFNSIYTAEHYDAQLEQKGWDCANFDDSQWGASIIRAAPSQNIVSQQLHPIRNRASLKPVKVERVDDKDIFVVDFGKTIAGVTQIFAKGEKGDTIKLIHGEKLFDNGRVSLDNLDVHYRPTDDTDPFQTDIFILKGEGVEQFMPRFNYKGFRYVEVSSSSDLEMTSEDILAWEMSSDVPAIGNFNSSNSLINKLWEATNNSYLSNLFGYPTDCPQREKNGWTGDAHIAIETGLYNYDAITVYEKWLADHQDEQQPDGTLPSIIPTGGWGYQWGNGPDWTSTIAIIPWNIYLYYGDSRLLESCYENIKQYVDNITYKYPTGLTTWGLGDWIPVKSQSTVEFGSSIYYYVDTKILANAAKLFNRVDDYEKYTALAEKIKKAFNEKYLNRENGVYDKGIQTQQSSTLYWDIVPEDMKSKVVKALAESVEADDCFVDVGLLGSKTILNALSDNGYADLAYKMVSKDTYPSWGYWIATGATTLYEAWDETQGEVSLNHIMFGEISAWFYKALAGIKVDSEEPGFKNILLQPNFVDGLSYAGATFDSPYGVIEAKWRREGKKVLYEIVIPPSATAELTVPKGFVIKGIEDLSMRCQLSIASDMDLYNLKSGSYICEFVARK